MFTDNIEEKMTFVGSDSLVLRTENEDLDSAVSDKYRYSRLDDPILRAKWEAITAKIRGHFGW